MLIKDKAPNTKKIHSAWGLYSACLCKCLTKQPHLLQQRHWEEWFGPGVGWGSQMKSSCCSPVSEPTEGALVTALAFLHPSETGAKPRLRLYDVLCSQTKSIPTSHQLKSPRLLLPLTPESHSTTFLQKLVTNDWNKVAQKYRMLITPTINEKPTEVRDREQSLLYQTLQNYVSHNPKAGIFFLHWLLHDDSHNVLNSLGFSIW